jgi:hypothetical protein
MKYQGIREEELKNKVALDYFCDFDCTKIIGNLDFCVCVQSEDTELFEYQSLLWAEAKRGGSDIYESFVQLILTIGKARTFDKYLPPAFLGAFDGEKIAFIEYSDIQDIFYQNDFNWNVTPSNKATKEFSLIYEKTKNIISDNALLFNLLSDDAELKKFIKNNFVVGKKETSKIQIDKNNFINIYNKWLDVVKPTISYNWVAAKPKGILDGDFYLADLLSRENITLKDGLFAVLCSNCYEMNRFKDEFGAFSSSTVYFSDNQKAHNQFWIKYERPPLKEYWNYIMERRDLLVPQDIRERKGSYFTPKIWVELSQKYLADTFGENWQDEYYVWDCAAGTGNLLVGLTNKYNIYASTIDKADVDIMKDRIQNGANLLENHVFQFDFLNDDFTKLPQSLQDIINNPKLRKKLIIYINPPYAEATSTATRAGTRENKIGVATNSIVYQKYSKKLCKARKELFAQFLARIYFELPDCKVACFSTLKEMVSPNFANFRKFFFAQIKNGFMVPATTFDNVTGNFQIGFNIWDTADKVEFTEAVIDVYDARGHLVGNKIHRNNQSRKYINDWIKEYKNKTSKPLAKLCFVGNDFQNQAKVQICSDEKKIVAHDVIFEITISNIIQACIYFAVRRCITHTWINHRDQFLYPNNAWENDIEFHNDCLLYASFHSNNNISSKHGVNHWIPFSEVEVNAKTRFESHFMQSFISGKIIQNAYSDLFNEEEKTPFMKREFSAEATAVFDAGRTLWKYYHKQKNINVNASLYDIREHFQGRNKSGKMNNKSEDIIYNELIDNLRFALNVLAKKIEPKVYEYEFLMR